MLKNALVLFNVGTCSHSEKSYSSTPQQVENASLPITVTPLGIFNDANE